MYKILRCVLDERRKGTRGEMSVSVSGTVEDEVSKKALAEKLTPALDDLESTGFLDHSGKVVFPKVNKTKTSQTAEQKLVADFKALTKKSPAFDIMLELHYPGVS